VLRQPCPALRSTSSPPKYAILDEAGFDLNYSARVGAWSCLRAPSEKVNAALKEGWQPHGAPFIHVGGAAVVPCQAMVNFHQPTSAETIAKLRRAAAGVFRR